MYYYLKNSKNGNIENFSNNREDMLETLLFMKQCNSCVYETDDEIVLNPQNGTFCFKKDILDIIEEERKKEIAMLNMTRLDFIKALEEIGVSWNVVKGLFEKYPDVEKELMLCSNVYRGNPLIDQMAALVDPSITPEVLDQLFIRHQFEQEFNNIELGDLQ